MVDARLVVGEFSLIKEVGDAMRTPTFSLHPEPAVVTGDASIPFATRRIEIGIGVRIIWKPTFYDEFFESPTGADEFFVVRDCDGIVRVVVWFLSCLSVVVRCS
jgi:hypothetical protein